MKALADSPAQSKPLNIESLNFQKMVIMERMLGLRKDFRYR